MAQWTIDVSDGLLSLRMEGSFSVPEIMAFVVAHNAAVDFFGGAEYRVFCDIRELRALNPACGEQFEKAKAHSAGQAGFQGSAVLVSSKIVAMQHQRSSVMSGVMSTELISHSEEECRAHLASVRRTPA